VVTANTWYKLCTLLVSLVVWPMSFTLTGYIGIIASFFGVCWYTYLRTHPYHNTVIVLPTIQDNPNEHNNNNNNVN